MFKYLPVLLWGILLITSGINCVSVDETYPIGAVKVSYFCVIEGKFSRKPQAIYLALISKEWAEQNERRLNEPFEKLKLPPGRPAVKIASNKEIMKLISLIRKRGFYSLTPTNPARFTVEEMERGAFRTRVFVVETDGLARYVALEDLSPEQIQTFRKIRNIFYDFFKRIESPFTKIEVEKNWRRIPRQQPPRR